MYISYANIVWASTFKAKLQEVLKKQNHATRITFHANRFDHLRPLLNKMEVLNFYQINLIQTIKLMHKLKYEINPRVFIPNFCETGHQHPTKFSQNSFD